MKVVFDTSVLVAAIVEPHPMHAHAFPWLRRARAREIEMFVACHTLAELYAVLTTLPVRPKLSAPAVWRLIRENVEAVAKIVPLSVAEYLSTVRDMAELGLTGGIIYDTLIAKAAQKAGVDKLLTLNPEDFRQAWPEGAAVIGAP